MFFKKLFGHKETLSFSNVECLVLETNGMHFELIPKHQMVKYRNVISPAEANKRFPDGYFVEKTSTILNHDIELISTAFNRMFQTGAPKSEFLTLPPGASRDVHMRIVFDGNRTVYCSNKRVHQGGFTIEREKAAPVCTQIVQILKNYCAFPKYEYIPVRIPDMPDVELIEKSSVYLESDKKDHLIGYLFGETRSTEYVFFKAGEKICSVWDRPFEPLSLVTILGDGVEMKSEFENCTIFPGLTRTVQNESEGKQFEICYKNRGRYTINETIAVYCSKEEYAFYSDGTVIATIKDYLRGRESPALLLDLGDDWFPYYSVDYCTEIDKELLMIILAFPILKFGF